MKVTRLELYKLVRSSTTKMTDCAEIRNLIASNYSIDLTIDENKSKISTFLKSLSENLKKYSNNHVFN